MSLIIFFLLCLLSESSQREFLKNFCFLDFLFQNILLATYLNNMLSCKKNIFYIFVLRAASDFQYEQQSYTLMQTLISSN